MCLDAVKMWSWHSLTSLLHDSIRCYGAVTMCSGGLKIKPRANTVLLSTNFKLYIYRFGFGLLKLVCITAGLVSGRAVFWKAEAVC